MLDTSHPDYVADAPPRNRSGVYLTPEAKANAFNVFLRAVECGTSLRKALVKAGISWRTVQHVLEREEAQAARYARARCAAADLWADRAVSHAMAAVDKDTAPAARVRFEAARWRASVQNADAWSERASTVNVQVNLTANALSMDVLRTRAVENDATVTPPLAPNVSDTPTHNMLQSGVVEPNAR